MRRTLGETIIWLHSYGPFNIPKKESWVIVGSGPSATRDAMNSIDENKGIVSLNGVISSIPRTDVHIISHYEDYFSSFPYLNKAPIAFIANPMHVGFRCLPVTSYQMLDANFYCDHDADIRFFEKDADLQSAMIRDHALYIKSNIATAALHLLHKNGVKTFETLGIDGGIGHSDAFPNIHYYAKEFDNSYEEGFAEFSLAADTLEMARA